MSPHKRLWRGNWLKSLNGTLFRTCEDGAGWHLIPTEISPVQSSFLRQIRTGILREGII